MPPRQPRLIHPVSIALSQIDLANTPPLDPDYREPTSAPVSTVRFLRCQLGLGKTDAFRQRPGGDSPEADGHIVFRAVDLDDQDPPVVLHKGDRVTLLYAGTPGEQSVNWTVLEVRPQGHYLNKPTMFFAYYKATYNQSEIGR